MVAHAASTFLKSVFALEDFQCRGCEPFQQAEASCGRPSPQAKFRASEASRRISSKLSTQGRRWKPEILVTGVTAVEVEPSSCLVVVDDERALEPRIVDGVVVERGAVVHLRRGAQFGGRAHGDAPG